ncbi:hypothetical protein BH10PLA2_BH10PLA2_34200 [soil metagenome]
MLHRACVLELEKSWLPNITDAGLERVIDLLQKESPLLIHGCFTKAVPMGCRATHIAWNHPASGDCAIDAGIHWLYHVAHLNPATSLMIREWDSRGSKDWNLRMDLLEIFGREAERRREQKPRSAVRKVAEAFYS